MSSEENGASIEMPRYKCHKEVWALKILMIESDINAARAENRETDDSAVLVFEFPYAPIRVASEWHRKHLPTPGGYFVVYKDGYKSFSPAVAFEDGYTPVKA